MKLKLTQRYNYNNEQGAEVEIIDMKRDPIFASGFGVLARLNGRKEPVWLTVDWVVPQAVIRPTPRALDAANICRVINHFYVDGVCSQCGSIEPPRQ